MSLKKKLKALASYRLGHGRGYEADRIFYGLVGRLECRYCIWCTRRRPHSLFLSHTEAASGDKMQSPSVLKSPSSEQFVFSELSSSRVRVRSVPSAWAALLATGGDLRRAVENKSCALAQSLGISIYSYSCQMPSSATPTDRRQCVRPSPRRVSRRGRTPTAQAGQRA